MPSPADLDRRAVGSIATAVALAAFLVAALSFVAVAHDAQPKRVDASADVGLIPTVDLTLTEFEISPASVTADPGPLTLRVVNEGTMAHDIEVKELGKKTIELQPGAAAELDLGTVAEGHYTILCTVAGHADSGMTGMLMVGSTDPASAGNHGGTSGGAAVQEEFDNAQMEKDMTKGVTTFLDYAKKYATGEVETGNRPLEPTVLADSTKRFDLTAAITDWEVSPGKTVKAWTYNGMVPGPWIRVDPGDRVEVVLKNELPVSTDIHLHGVDVPFQQDGVAPITQKFIEPGDSYTYRFTVAETPKLGMYHAHMHGQAAIVNGLFAIFQVGDVDLPRGRTINGIEVPAGLSMDDIQEVPMVVNDAGVIGLTLNGKAFPETQPIVAKKDDWLLIHFFNEGLQGHPMHLHRQPQLVVAKDGYPLTAPYRMDTLWVAPGERYSVLVKAEEVGTWAFHCHIVSHAENDTGLFGMVTALVVQ
ncbi:MAG: multicopper oxidase domain-containing protein [Acidimicrobiales bacterium]